MPNYDYQCAKCNKGFECFQSMKDEPLKTCPKDLCRMKTWGKGKVSRQIGTGAGLLFKGSGFYITDYRSEGYKAAAKSDSSSASASSSSSSDGGSSSKSSSKSEGSSKGSKGSKTS
jgi:putative FmdB family regulatory protein